MGGHRWHVTGRAVGESEAAQSIRTRILPRGAHSVRLGPLRVAGSRHGAPGWRFVQPSLLRLMLFAPGPPERADAGPNPDPSRTRPKQHPPDVLSRPVRHQVSKSISRPVLAPGARLAGGDSRPSTGGSSRAALQNRARQAAPAFPTRVSYAVPDLATPRGTQTRKC